MDDVTWKNRKVLPRLWPEYMRVPRDGCAYDEPQISLIVAGFFAFGFLTLIGIIAVVSQ